MSWGKEKLGHAPRWTTSISLAMVTAAVQQDWRAMEYASVGLRADRDFVFEATPDFLWRRLIQVKLDIRQLF